ncbi:hypothetical protein CCACVL1_22985 [Corchorus capsularis]|uniref:Uncharacterized protein n=1 Tax=Corchorus capsularis TaxID=210143 RepID=A0A1R3GVQ2_COCAP|nr:hypothetical protein CCACVL1_22985 [Corchorus capsularis]
MAQPAEINPCFNLLHAVRKLHFDSEIEIPKD